MVNVCARAVADTWSCRSLMPMHSCTASYQVLSDTDRHTRHLAPTLVTFQYWTQYLVRNTFLNMVVVGPLRDQSCSTAKRARETDNDTLCARAPLASTTDSDTLSLSLCPIMIILWMASSLVADPFSGPRWKCALCNMQATKSILCIRWGI